MIKGGRSLLLGLAGVQSLQGDSLDGDHLESDSRDISDGVALSAEASHEHLVVLVQVVQASILGHEGGDLLAVLLQEHSDTLPDGGVGLLGLDSHLLDDESLGVGGSHERVPVPGTEESLVVVLVVPSLDSPLVGQLSAGK